MIYLASLLELAGAALVIYAIATVAPALAIALCGFALLVAGYSLGRTN